MQSCLDFRQKPRGEDLCAMMVVWWKRRGLFVFLLLLRSIEPNREQISRSYPFCVTLRAPFSASPFGAGFVYYKSCNHSSQPLVGAMISFATTASPHPLTTDDLVLARRGRSVLKAEWLIFNIHFLMRQDNWNPGSPGHFFNFGRWAAWRGLTWKPPGGRQIQ